MAPLHPFPAPSIPPSPTLPILLPPLALLAILLILYIRRPATLVPTRPMATIKTPLLAGTRARIRARGHHRIGSYGGIRVSGSCGEDCEEGYGKGDGRATRGRSDKRPRLVRRDDEDLLVDTSASHTSEEEERSKALTPNTRNNSIPTLSGHEQGENDSSDDQGPSTPDEVVAPIHFRSDRVDKVAVKGVEVCEREVMETPVEERMAPTGMNVSVVCA